MKISGTKMFLILVSALLIAVQVQGSNTSNRKVQSTPQMIIDKFMDKQPLELFRIWHHLNNKESEYSVDSDEFQERLVYFERNVQKVKAHNSRKDRTWEMTLDVQADRRESEIYDSRMCQDNEMPQEKSMISKTRKSDFYLAGGFEWEDIGLARLAGERKPIDWTDAAGPVYNQGNCYSHYAGVLVNSIESHYFLKYGQRISLSKQQIIDCNYRTEGCAGGWFTKTANYVYTYGLVDSSAYPTTNAVDFCKAELENSGKKYITGFAGAYMKGDSDYRSSQLYTADSLYYLLSKGPVYMEVFPPMLSGYKSGILDPTNMSCGCGLHAVLVVGYGVDENGVAYWKMKNSRGDTWGEKGYYRLKALPQAHSCMKYFYTAIPTLI